MVSNDEIKIVFNEIIVVSEEIKKISNEKKVFSDDINAVSVKKYISDERKEVSDTIRWPLMQDSILL